MLKTENKNTGALHVIKRVVWYVICCIIGWILGIGLYMITTHTSDIKTAFTSKEVVPPENPRWPSDADIGHANYDISSDVQFVSNVCVITKSDGVMIRAEKATDDEVKILNEHVDTGDYEYGWVDIHDGYDLCVYTFTHNNTKYVFYQHNLYTDRVYVSKEVMTDS